ncbi:Nitroreductase [Sphingomonas gellani]|uniref:Putative NAD(P)H nitroreductase n=1 Tax=Sphingomonas gellani TaxID=1166340 RepID=A0A1H8DK80_9SPHN|nr:nitroreductase [Sphingomonas gellani]SEN07575.1 Nitroreductase [Sphingomonas gellani]
MFNDRSTPLSLLLTRRSGKPRDLVAPGPDADELDTILRVAARTPDHGKLAPWRFVIVQQDRRDALARLIADAYREERPAAPDSEVAAFSQFAHQAPTLVVTLSSPQLASSIPVWEQELSAGAAAMNLNHGAHALGYAAGWLTGWPAFSDRVRDAFGQAPERIVGFTFIGTPSRPLDERPRPDMSRIVSRWGG